MNRTSARLHIAIISSSSPNVGAIGFWHKTWTPFSAAKRTSVKWDSGRVQISTKSHLTLVRLAAENGVHVLCQKPIAPTLGELEEMIAICKRADVRFMVHENFRWRSWYLR